MLKLTAPPSPEPVSLAEAKAHLRVDVADDDTLIGTLITAARQHVEAVTGRALMPQTWEYYIDAFPADGGAVEIPIAPLTGITKVSFADPTTGAFSDATLTDYQVDMPAGERAQRGTVVPKTGKTWPSDVSTQPNSARFTFTAGYADAASVPAALKAAILLLVGDLYANREARMPGSVADNPTVDRLLFPFRLQVF